MRKGGVWFECMLPQCTAHSHSLLYAQLVNALLCFIAVPIRCLQCRFPKHPTLRIFSRIQVLTFDIGYTVEHSAKIHKKIQLYNWKVRQWLSDRRGARDNDFRLLCCFRQQFTSTTRLQGRHQIPSKHERLRAQFTQAFPPQHLQEPQLFWISAWSHLWQKK